MTNVEVVSSRSVISSDIGRLLTFGGSFTFEFNDDPGTDFTGKRFEFFNTHTSAVTIKFANNVYINGSLAGPSGLSISLPAGRHMVVMGIGNDIYVAWMTSGVTLS
jgi:hypothetical protein